jgi:hypothetical protein
LLEKIANAVLDVIDPPKPLPPPPPEPKLEERPDPKQVALEMRALAGWLHAQADRLDPMVLPSFSVPPSDLLPPRWNTVLDETGDSGGVVKRKGAEVELNRRRPPEHETIVDMTEAEQTEFLQKIQGVHQECCGGHCRCHEGSEPTENTEKKS